MDHRSYSFVTFVASVVSRYPSVALVVWHRLVDVGLAFVVHLLVQVAHPVALAVHQNSVAAGLEDHDCNFALAVVVVVVVVVVVAFVVDRVFPLLVGHPCLADVLEVHRILARVVFLPVVPYLVYLVEAVGNCCFVDCILAEDVEVVLLCVAVVVVVLVVH